MKSEGAVFSPIPVARQLRDSVAPVHRVRRESSDPRCEMCGAPVLATHCKRICLKCGFLTGCSEGI
jgi:hypothetical protein